MRWGKIILAIQAIIILIIGIALLQLSINYENQNNYQNNNNSLQLFNTGTYTTIKDSFYNSSYILFLVGLLELIIIWRLVS